MLIRGGSANQRDLVEPSPLAIGGVVCPSRIIPGIVV